jgi:shikimate dehydrogenase
MLITAKTKVLALLGWPVEHSASPLMHNAAFQEMGIPYCYVALPVRPQDLPDAIKAIKALNLRGVNITVPHKEAAASLVDELDEEARFIGAINTIVNEEGTLKGYNTDGRGFMQSLKEEGIEVRGKRVLILGAGGASRAISYYLARECAELLLYDTAGQKARRLAQDLQALGHDVKALQEVKGLQAVDVLINATPLGLKPHDPLPVAAELLHPALVVGDLIYWRTPLLEEASRRGLRCFDGLGMLLWQGVLASELWTGRRPPHQSMRQALLQGLGRG